MKIVEHNLKPGSKFLIKKMWLIEESITSEIEVRSFPVGYPFLNVVNGSKVRIEFEDKQGFHTNSYLAGQRKSPFQLNMKTIRRGLTIQLQPFALFYLLGIPSHELSGYLLPIKEFNYHLAEELEDLTASDLPSQTVLIESEKILLKHCTKLQLDPRVPAAFQKMLITRGELPIKQLADYLNLSQRRLQQIFQENFGLTPKSYSRVIKMQYHTYRILSGNDINRIIPDGYYDQSHFIHELRKQTGFLPSEYAAYINDPSKKQAYLSSNIYSS